jgi:hypothetical protein
MRFLVFIFAAIGAVAGIVTILLYFGISSDRLRIHMALPALPSVWWLVAAVCLFITSFGLSGYGLYRVRSRAEFPADTRRLLIERWRVMVNEVHGETRTEGNRKSVTELLEAHRPARLGSRLERYSVCRSGWPRSERPRSRRRLLSYAPHLSAASMLDTAARIWFAWAVVIFLPVWALTWLAKAARSWQASPF